MHILILDVPLKSIPLNSYILTLQLLLSVTHYILRLNISAVNTCTHVSASFSQSLACCVHADVPGKGHTQTSSACQPTLCCLCWAPWCFQLSSVGQAPELGIVVGDIIISDMRSHKELLCNQTLPVSLSAQFY